MKKIFIIIAIFIAFAGVGLGMYFFGKSKSTEINPPVSKAPDDDLQNQKNNPPKENGPYVGEDFTIIAPPGWIQTHIPTTIVSFQNSQENHPSGSAAEKINFKSYMAVSFDNTQGKTLDEIVKLVKQQTISVAPSVSFSSETSGTIDGQPAKFLEAELAQQDVEFKVIIAIVFKEDKYFTISANTTAQKWPEYQNPFYDAINSFKFK
jgi:hypothetical protein